MAKKEKEKEIKTDEEIKETAENNEAVENEEDVQDPLSQMQAELEKQKDIYMRMAAEYANYRTRCEKERIEIYSNATVDAIKNILPVADSIELAIKSCGDVSEEYKKGIELIATQLEKAFTSLGVESFGERGEKFDPEIHNAIAKIEDESLDENTISLVFQKGYKCKDKIIRYCMVQVAN